MSEFKIGAPKVGSGRVDFEKWFNIQPGDNFYRILPPCYSFADSGKWSTFYSTHKVLTKDGLRQFVCLEEKDHKTKLINRHCPFCDRAEEAKAYYEQIKTQGATKEQLEDFYNTQVEPYKPNKAFYVNAMDQAGKISILPIKYKLFQDVQNLHRDILQREQIDVVDINGAYLVIKKRQAFKGDRNTTYGVDLATRRVSVDGKTYSETMLHSLTEAEITEYSKKGRDLSKLFKVISPEEAASLCNAEGDERQAIIDRIWSKPERTMETKPNTGLDSTIGGTTVKAVSRIEMDGGVPKMKTPGFTPKAAVPQAPVATQEAAPEAPAEAPAPVAPAKPAATPPAGFRFGGAPAAKTVTGLNDADFLKTFRSRGK